MSPVDSKHPLFLQIARIASAEFSCLSPDGSKRQSFFLRASTSQDGPGPGPGPRTPSQGRSCAQRALRRAESPSAPDQGTIRQSLRLHRTHNMPRRLACRGLRHSCQLCASVTCRAPFTPPERRHERHSAERVRLLATNSRRPASADVLAS
jgi:hypothetical protein